ncbi:GGDEF domain-containing protein [Humidesulfovibrio sp.]
MGTLAVSLELGTLLLVLLCVTLVRVLAMLHYASQRRVYPGFRTLIYSTLLVFIGVGLLVQRAWAEETLLLVLLNNLVMLVQPAMVFHGLGEYGRVPHLRARTKYNCIFIAVVVLLQLADVLFDPNMERRVLVFSAAALVLNIRIAAELPASSKRRLPGWRIMCFSYFVTAILQILRAYNVLHVPGFGELSMQTAQVIGVYSVLYRIAQGTLELYVVFAMNSALLEDDLHAATSRIERMAQTDALTGALNRRGMELLGGEALRKSFRQGDSASVVMFDLDRFKRVNDTLGHVAGDELLRAVAALCRGSLREGDVFARYGGEEFVVIAPRAGEREAFALAERLRQDIESAKFPATQGERVTASFGVASAAQGGLEALLKRADEALYTAKECGRNKVVLAAQPAVCEAMA